MAGPPMSGAPSLRLTFHLGHDPVGHLAGVDQLEAQPPKRRQPAGEHELEQQGVELRGSLDGPRTGPSSTSCSASHGNENRIRPPPRSTRGDEMGLSPRSASSRWRVPSTSVAWGHHPGLVAACTTASTPAVAAASPRPMRRSPRTATAPSTTSGASRREEHPGPGDPDRQAGRRGCRAPPSRRSPARSPREGTLGA